MEVDPNLKGTYRIHIAYHVVALEFTGSDWYIPTDLSDDLIYCYQYCTYNIAPIHNGGYNGNTVWISDSGGTTVYTGSADANGNVPGKWGFLPGTFTITSGRECWSVYRPEPPGYDYYYFQGHATVTIGPDVSPTLTWTNTHVSC